MINVIIVAAVAAVLALCIKSIVKNRGDGCAACAEGPTCSARITGVGKCPATEDMLRDVDAALEKAQGKLS